MTILKTIYFTEFSLPVNVVVFQKFEKGTFSKVLRNYEYSFKSKSEEQMRDNIVTDFLKASLGDRPLGR
jgi:hypothetical protein